MKKTLLIIIGIIAFLALISSDLTLIKKIILLLLAFSAFYKYGTEDNFWFKLGKWSKKIY